MTRSTVRTTAFVVLALLGAPVAMHVVMHDLHGHHDDPKIALGTAENDADHEHPIVSSPPPQVPNLTPLPLPIAFERAATPAAWARVAKAERNVVALGALRTDTDVGLQPLLATYLI